jgi:hypothetical protein
MTQYTIRTTDGRTCTECSYSSSDNASGVRGILAELFGENVTLGYEEQDGLADEDGRQPMRRLVWASAEDADGDDGSRAVASVRWTD